MSFDYSTITPALLEVLTWGHRQNGIDELARAQRVCAWRAEQGLETWALVIDTCADHSAIALLSMPAFTDYAALNDQEQQLVHVWFPSLGDHPWPTLELAHLVPSGIFQEDSEDWGGTWDDEKPNHDGWTDEWSTRKVDVPADFNARNVLANPAQMEYISTYIALHNALS